VNVNIAKRKEDLFKYLAKERKIKIIIFLERNFTAERARCTYGERKTMKTRKLFIKIYNFCVEN